MNRISGIPMSRPLAFMRIALGLNLVLQVISLGSETETVTLDPHTFGFINETTGAVGHEFDVRLSTLQRATADPVIKGLVEPEGIVTVASSHDDRRVIDYNAEGHKPRVGDEQTIAEIIYWERPQVGRVFHTGSIATAWGMYHDDSLSKLIRNVLHHFGMEGEK